MRVTIGVQSLVLSIGSTPDITAPRKLVVRVLDKYGQDLWSCECSKLDVFGPNDELIAPALSFARAQGWFAEVDRQQLQEAIAQQTTSELFAKKSRLLLTDKRL